jgi:histidinol dehydrogenase
LRIVTGFELAKTVLSRRTRGEDSPDEREATVREIIGEVQRHRDSALYKYTEKFDGIKLTSLQVKQEQVALAYQKTDEQVVFALNLAAERIRNYHNIQKSVLLHDSVKSGVGWIIRPLERVGIHVPGFTSPLPSSLLMTVIPAKVAGVGEVILVTPPQKNGEVAPVTLVAADVAGVDRIFSIGGAQAIAALAFGTETIPSVDKIIGPGNAFVILAKKLLFGTVGIDALQGPSEVLIIADETTNIEFCAADLLAQAEHASGSVVLVTTSMDLADRIVHETEAQLKNLPKPEIASESLAKNGVVAVVESLEEAIELANLYAPEHLLLMVDKATSYVEKVRNAGCIVTGKKGTIALGDYLTGPSHVLPTGGTARFASPLTVLDFVKLTSISNIDDSTIKKIGPAARILANAEGMDAHAKAVEKRLKS